MRYHHAPDASFDAAAKRLWRDGMGAAFKSGAARLAITGANPALLSNEDPDKVGRANRAVSQAYRPALELITRHEINWTIVASASPAWAAQMFPDDALDVSLGKLWEAIFQTTRINMEDPVSDWKRHDAGLHKRADYLNAKRYAALKYRGPGTDFTSRAGGRSRMDGRRNDSRQRNLLHSQYAHRGSVQHASQGSRGWNSDGDQAIVSPGHHDRGHTRTLRGGAESLRRTRRAARKCCCKLIETDDGARRLGEVALVPHSSPIASSGQLFLNTLFDENAASHIALGQAYSSCVRDGDKLSKKELAAKGANDSLIHVDWMIGSDKLDIDGITSTGTAETAHARRRGCNRSIAGDLSTSDQLIDEDLPMRGG